MCKWLKYSKIVSKENILKNMYLISGGIFHSTTRFHSNVPIIKGFETSTDIFQHVAIFFTGFWSHKSWICRWPSSKMSFLELVSESQIWFVIVDFMETNRYFFIVCSIGRPKHIRVMAGALEDSLFIGPKAQEHRGLLSIRYPMEVGLPHFN